MVSCPDCNGTGYLPLFDKQGNAVPNARVDCACLVKVDKYAPIGVEDFDFPMSDVFRAASFEYCETRDPGKSVVSISEDVQRRVAAIETEMQTGSQPSRFRQIIQQITSRVNYLQNKLNELDQRKRKSRGQY